jgi:ubiquinol-cytochrome c reductase cytochrome c1 subunit
MTARRTLFCVVAAAGLFAAGLLSFNGGALAATDRPLESAENNVANTASLQRGARYFVNYCLGCHSARYVRYNTLGAYLGLTETQLIDNLMFTGERPHDTMEIAMRPDDAARWFGITPPDLTLISRSHGTDYVYSFLRGFYADDSTISGWNNLYLENSAMPNVLWELQGIRAANFEQTGDDSGTFLGFEAVTQGQLSEAEFDQVVRDIVNFLDFIGEPVQLERQALGIRVIAFLLVFLLIAYLLKREIWRDVK